MPDLLTRRRLLTTGIAAAAMSAPVLRAASAASAKTLTATSRILEVNGKAARVFGLVGPDGKPGLTLAPGENFRVDLVNTIDDPTLIHWHGQLPPWLQDGFPWPQMPALPAGTTRSYDYRPIAGTHWMHSHHGLQEQSLMTAPLIVHSASELREDRQEIVLMLHDFSFRPPLELLANLTGKTVAEAERMATQSENVPSPRERAISAQSTMSHEGMPAGGPAMGMTMPHGGAPDLTDIDYDAFLANDRTLADPEVVRVPAGGRVRVRIINAASASQFWIDLGRLPGLLVAVDGHPVHPIAGSRFALATAQRLDILLDLPGHGAFPVLADVEGRRSRTGIILATAGAQVAKIDGTLAQQSPALDNSLEARLRAVEPLPARQPDLVHQIVLSGNMRPYSWALNGQYWPDIVPLMLLKGQRVEIEMTNRTTMPHPMHLHGHAFQVTALNGQPVAGAVRDTVLVPPRGQVTFVFDADNPGRWGFHCHNLYHMATGMITEFRYDGIM